MLEQCLELPMLEQCLECPMLDVAKVAFPHGLAPFPQEGVSSVKVGFTKIGAKIFPFK